MPFVKIDHQVLECEEGFAPTLIIDGKHHFYSGVNGKAVAFEKKQDAWDFINDQ